MPLHDEPADLEVIQEEPVALPDIEAQALARADAEDFDKRAREETLRRLKHENKQLKQDRRERRRYARQFFYLACSWVLFLATLLVFQGFQAYSSISPFLLSDNVLIAVMGSTTVNVLGILYVVATYLFPKK